MQRMDRNASTHQWSTARTMHIAVLMALDATHYACKCDCAVQMPLGRHAKIHKFLQEYEYNMISQGTTTMPKCTVRRRQANSGRERSLKTAGGFLKEGACMITLLRMHDYNVLIHVFQRLMHMSKSPGLIIICCRVANARREPAVQAAAARQARRGPV